ncbi:hypothetical protein PMAYCL1PPCAC_28123, partial [Pristionchus mayeri]
LIATHAFSLMTTGEYIRIRCEGRAKCFNADCDVAHELQRCIEMAATHVAIVMSACTGANCPQSEAEASEPKPKRPLLQRRVLIEGYHPDFCKSVW